jgi:hypothetical protein
MSVVEHRFECMTTLAFAGDLTLTRFGIRLTQLHDELWRVTRLDGEVLGYVEQFPVREGVRYRAKMLMARTRRFVVMGEFWNAEDAVDTFL